MYVILKSFRIVKRRIVLIPSRMQIVLESPRDFYERIKRKSRRIGKPGSCAGGGGVGVGGRQRGRWRAAPSHQLLVSRNKERRTLHRLVIVSRCKISHSIYVRLTAASKIHEGSDYMRVAMHRVTSSVLCRRQKGIHTRLYKLKRDYVAAVATNMPCLFNASVL